MNISRPVRTATSGVSTLTRCLHCGAENKDAASNFCCTGCEAAYALISGLGLDTFYARREGQTEGTLRPQMEDLPQGFSTRAESLSDGRYSIDLMVMGLTCGACVWLIEQTLATDPVIRKARVSLSTRRLTVEWTGTPEHADVIAANVARLGFRVAPWTPACLAAGDDAERRSLIWALGIAAFGSMNVMLVSVAVWAGTDMGDATRSLMHWLSALFGMPVILISGMPFYRSAWRALRAGRANMDTAISLAVLLTGAMSLSETLRNGTYTWFDGATLLLFLLLVGRVLDRGARSRARRAAADLLALQQGSVTRLDADNVARLITVDAVRRGDVLLVATGERLAVDASTNADAILDMAVITGESLPQNFAAHAVLPAGALNIGAPIRVTALSTNADSSLSTMVRMMDRASEARGRFVTLADQMAGYYVPVVHALALLTFLGWWLGFGADWQTALVIGVSVLIITCPCGFAIAVPSVQVVTVGSLFRKGILVTSGTALERLAQADYVMFDKTGTLTAGHPTLLPDPVRTPEDEHLAASIALASRHPLARALVRAVPDIASVSGDVQEVPGGGLMMGNVRLGSPQFCGLADTDMGMALVLAQPEREPVVFRFSDRLRADAAQTVRDLRALGIEAELMSGDAAGAVADAACAVGIERHTARATPADKAARLETLRAEGRKVLMVGDGVNDGPALAAAHVSASPAGATDLAQAASDFVLQSGNLHILVDAVHAARQAQTIAKQNIGFSLLYNVVAVPLAIFGLVIPPIAALVMTSSGLVVICNSLRAGSNR